MTRRDQLVEIAMDAWCRRYDPDAADSVRDAMEDAFDAIEPSIRADEGEKIAQPLDARAAVARSQAATRSGPKAVAKYLEVAEAYAAAARLARSGGRDE